MSQTPRPNTPGNPTEPTPAGGPGGANVIRPQTEGQNPQAARPGGRDERSVFRPKRPQEFEELKIKTHRELLEKLDLVALASLSREQAESQIRVAIARLLEQQSTPLSRIDRERLIEEIAHEVLGLGPLDPLLQDGDISDILINGPENIYVEKRGKLERTAVRFRDNQHLLQIIDRIVSRIGRRVDESSPMVDARLPDGSRVNVIIPPLALNGAVMSIRRFGRDPYKMADLLAFRSMTDEMAEVLRTIVRARCNIVVSGGTGSGKTTLLNCLSSFIPENERIVTVEDSAELQLQQPHVVRLESRPANLEGRGEVTTRDLVRNCLRMRPDRIVVGEVRGAEALDMLQAMNTGHDGSITTIHANNPRECIQRLEMMVLMAGMEIPMKAIRQQISSAVHVLVQVRRLADGTRKVVKINEVNGMEGDTVLTQDIFEYVQTGINKAGIVEGYYRSTGVRPTFLDRIVSGGMTLDENWFKARPLT